MYSKPAINRTAIETAESACSWITVFRTTDQGRQEPIANVNTGLPSFATCTNPTLAQLNLCRVTVSNQATGLGVSACGFSNFQACATAPGTNVSV